MKCESGLPIIYQMVNMVFPEVHRCLGEWERQAALIKDNVLRTHAFMSIEKKKFHCQGGCSYALYPTALASDAIQFIVAYQTISDYLDNLCDRAGIMDETAFRQLHLAMADAIDPDAMLHNYYEFYPNKDDGGYLDSLVAGCRREIERLPSFEAVKNKMIWLVSLYSELQVLKHGLPGMREESLFRWAAPLAVEYPGISVWEFCAASGSTLGIFLLFVAAQSPRLASEEAEALLGAYFPWVCGLHILLDYFIDAEEDREEGDFNFISYYSNLEECEKRLCYFIDQSLQICAGLRFPEFHKTVIRGLLAMYLSDRKTRSSKSFSKRIIRRGGNKAIIYYDICKALRNFGKL